MKAIPEPRNSTDPSLWEVTCHHLLPTHLCLVLLTHLQYYLGCDHGWGNLFSVPNNTMDIFSTYLIGSPWQLALMTSLALFKFSAPLESMTLLSLVFLLCLRSLLLRFFRGSLEGYFLLFFPRSFSLASPTSTMCLTPCKVQGLCSQEPLDLGREQTYNKRVTGTQRDHSVQRWHKKSYWVSSSWWERNGKWSVFRGEAESSQGRWRETVQRH